jgi:hypothetical protein
MKSAKSTHSNNFLPTNKKKTINIIESEDNDGNKRGTEKLPSS